MSLLPILLGLSGSAAVVVAAGVGLARSADLIAARTRLGGLWVGTVFLAVATSLPELTTDLSAVRLGAPDLAAGDLFGSSMANMLILALVSFGPGSGLFRHAALDNALVMALAILLTGVAALVVLLEPTFTVWRVGPGSLLIAALYLTGTRLLFRHSVLAREAGTRAEMSGAPAGEASHDEAGPSLRGAALRFLAAAAVILVAAPFFAASAHRLAEATGISASFVGTWLLGFATSLPELVTSLAAVRMRAYDLAVGNLFGSNAVNMVMVVPLDVAYGAGPFLGAIARVHAVTALVAIILMAMGLAAVVYRAQGKTRLVEPAGLLMLLAYVAGLTLVYFASAGP
jgi:cation:H+ antiporter